MERRKFIVKASQASLALSALGVYACNEKKKKEVELSKETVSKESSLFFDISLAQWSLHRALRSGNMNNLDFAVKSRALGCNGLEYVNGFFKDKVKDMAYLKEMNAIADSEGQKNVLIMIDQEGDLADADDNRRLKAIENHYKWVDAAHFLGCHAIRVNLAGGTDKDDAMKAAIDSLEKLSNFAEGSDINILVENHGGFSSNGDWMSRVFSQVRHVNCGTLPDFGNFCIAKDEDKNCVDAYDRYKGMRQLMPFAKAVSAKSYDFDEHGNETTIDFKRMMTMVKDFKYTGFVGVEFEGNNVSEEKGIQLTRDLLIKVGRELS
ncbi:TIM barrel protein [Tamlana fucoidanivorans]|uniref:TIM barrel protein n=1 Tax=Allotamlana fucoidanivorans TaxID=2583814 RepID=A0A5C4SPQ0_9FLAO|nr:TIM barrel protein [Tamlana fucoidanivorans]TNJ46232.1 TIM barrel protein [Tamlana fucoidanivorans]